MYSRIRIYRSIDHGPLDFDIAGFFCMCIYLQYILCLYNGQFSVENKHINLNSNDVSECPCIFLFNQRYEFQYVKYAQIRTSTNVLGSFYVTHCLNHIKC